MIGNCTFHILSVFSTDEFCVEAPSRFPEGTAGCFIYNGKRSEICDGLHYSVPQNISRSINMLIRRGHLSRTNLLGLRTMFAFVVHPKFFFFDNGGKYSASSRPAAASEVEPNPDSG